MIWLTRVCQVAWRFGRVPNDQHIDRPHTQEGDRNEWTIYRGFSLLSPPGRVYAKTPRKPKLDDTQCGFCRGRSTAEELSTLQQSLEILGHAKDVYICFVDLGKVYGRVPREKLWGMLWEHGVYGCLLLAVKSLNSCSEDCVPVDGVNSQPFSVGVGLRQWCVLSYRSSS